MVFIREFNKEGFVSYLATGVWIFILMFNHSSCGKVFCQWTFLSWFTCFEVGDLKLECHTTTANRMLRFVVQLPRNIKIWMSCFFKGHWTIRFGWFPFLSNFLQHILYLCWELKLTYTPLTCKCFWIELFMMNLQFLYFNFLSFIFFFYQGIVSITFSKMFYTIKGKILKVLAKNVNIEGLWYSWTFIKWPPSWYRQVAA